MMQFPDLRLPEEEREMHQRVNSALLGRMRRLFAERYRSNPQIKCSGSTEKGTALPEKYFGIDFDASVRADSCLLDRIAYRSDAFEGCQLFSIPFFNDFVDYFDGVYFAGHRLSGKIEGRDFDFSITDEEKDQWKWDYNKSKYLNLSGPQADEIKKVKFFFKTFNTYGTPVYGIVGPAVELLVFHHGNFEHVLKQMKNLEPVPEDFSYAFLARPFPAEFYNIFPESEDYIHRGLVESFACTMPNTFNRLVESVRAETLDVGEFLQSHKPRFTYKRKLNGKNNRLVNYFLDKLLQDEPYFHVDVLNEGKDMAAYAAASKGQERVLDKVLDVAESVQDDKELDIQAIPRRLREDVASKTGGEDPEKYTFFVGSPGMPLKQGKIYIPFDFLVREDANKLIKVMKNGQDKS